jgi:hypothetical protein
MNDDTGRLDETRLVAAAGADDTIVVPDVTPTGIAELAWSCDEDDDEPDTTPRRSLHWLLPWSLAVAAVLVTAAAVTWFGNILYHEAESKPAMAPIVHRPTPDELSPKPPSNMSPPGPTVTVLAPPPITVTAPPPVTVSALPPTVAPPTTLPLPEPPANAYDTYIGLLSRDGIVPTVSAQQMHDEAYYFCLAVDTDNTEAIQTLIQKSQQRSLGLGPASIRGMYADVVQAYCPQLADRPW